MHARLDRGAVRLLTRTEGRLGLVAECDWGRSRKIPKSALTAARKQLIRRRFCLANPQKKFPYPRGKNRGFPRLSELAAG